MRHHLLTLALVTACAHGADDNHLDTGETDDFETPGMFGPRDETLLAHLDCAIEAEREVIEAGSFEFEMPDDVDPESLWGSALDFDREDVGRIFRPVYRDGRIELRTTCFTEQETLWVIGAVVR